MSFENDTTLSHPNVHPVKGSNGSNRDCCRFYKLSSLPARPTLVQERKQKDVLTHFDLTGENPLLNRK